MKKQYIPCQLEVVEFNVERGFAASDLTAVSQEGVNNLLWHMETSTTQTNSDFRNHEQWQDQEITWFN